MSPLEKIKNNKKTQLLYSNAAIVCTTGTGSAFAKFRAFFVGIALVLIGDHFGLNGVGSSSVYFASTYPIVAFSTTAKNKNKRKYQE